MPTMVRCPACSSALRLPDNVGDRSAKCPKCFQVFYPGRVTRDTSPASANASVPSRRIHEDNDVVSDDFEVVDDEPQTGKKAAGDDFEVVDDEPKPEPIRRRKSLLDEAEDRDRSSRRNSRADDDDDRDPSNGRKSRVDDGDNRDRDRPSRKSILGDDDDRNLSETPRRKSKRSRRDRDKKATWLIIASIAGGIVFLGIVTGVVFAVRGLFDGAIDEEKWKTFEAPGRYKVLMPGKTEQRSQSMGPVTFNLNGCEYDGNTVFMILHSEGTPPAARMALPTEVLLNDACDGFIRDSKDGPVELKRESIKVGAYEGKLLVVNLKKRKVNVVVRVFMVGQRMYMIAAGGKGYDEDNVNVKKFFNSFELLDKP